MLAEKKSLLFFITSGGSPLPFNVILEILSFDPLMYLRHF